mmetsp:Transcript_33150/g.79024  ORF Transcript_33150/g.79024 Transcript_33150/m.79024 type:complete len:394 (-) Transcript_33150:155-1336(-)
MLLLAPDTPVACLLRLLRLIHALVRLLLDRLHDGIHLVGLLLVLGIRLGLAMHLEGGEGLGSVLLEKLQVVLQLLLLPVVLPDVVVGEGVHLADALERGGGRRSAHVLGAAIVVVGHRAPAAASVAVVVAVGVRVHEVPLRALPPHLLVEDLVAPALHVVRVQRSVLLRPLLVPAVERAVRVPLGRVLVRVRRQRVASQSARPRSNSSSSTARSSGGGLASHRGRDLPDVDLLRSHAVARGRNLVERKVELLGTALLDRRPSSHLVRHNPLRLLRLLHLGRESMGVVIMQVAHRLSRRHAVLGRSLLHLLGSTVHVRSDGLPRLLGSSSLRLEVSVKLSVRSLGGELRSLSRVQEVALLLDHVLLVLGRLPRSHSCLLLIAEVGPQVVVSLLG